MEAAYDFTSKVVIVTGASSGFGQATAILFAKLGASVVLCGRDEIRLKCSVEHCIEASGGHTSRFASVLGDVTKPEVRKAIVDKAVKTFHRLDILVASAGVSSPEDGIENATEQMYDEIFDSNVKAVFFLIKAALPYLEQSGGSIVNISSSVSTLAMHGRPIYTITKAAIDHMTRCLALDLAPKGIRVNAVNPSFVPTRFHRYLGAEDIVQKIAQQEAQNHPLYRKCVTVEAIADMIVFLASDAAKFVTGQCHIVDGARGYLGSP